MSDQQWKQFRVMPWLVWGISALFVLYQFLLQSSISVMIPQLMQDLKINVLDIGVLSSSFFYPYVILQIPAGILVDRFGARILLNLSILICAIATLIFAYANTLFTAEFSRLLMGMASAPSVVCGMYLACRWFDKEKFAMVAGLVEMIGILGGAIGQMCLTHLVGVIGWRHTMVVCVITACILLLSSFIFVQNQSPYKPHVFCQKMELTKLVKKFLAVMFIPQVWIACIYSGLMFSVITGFAGLWSIPFFQVAYNVSANFAAEASAIVFIGAAFGTGGIGYLACKYGRLRLIMTLCAVMSTLTMLAIIYISMAWLLLTILLFLLGVFSGAYVLAFAVVKRNTCHEISATAMGFTNMICIVLGAPVLQPLIGWLLMRFKHPNGYTLADYQIALLPMVLFLAVAIMVAFGVNDKSYCEE